MCTCVRTAVDRRPFFPFPFPFPPVKENQDHLYDPGNAYVWYLCFPLPCPPVKEKLDHVYDHGNVKNFPFPPARIKQDHVCDQRKDIEFAAFADYLNACVFIVGDWIGKVRNLLVGGPLAFSGLTLILGLPESSTLCNYAYLREE